MSAMASRDVGMIRLTRIRTFHVINNRGRSLMPIAIQNAAEGYAIRFDGQWGGFGANQGFLCPIRGLSQCVITGELEIPRPCWFLTPWNGWQLEAYTIHVSDAFIPALPWRMLVGSRASL